MKYLAAACLIVIVIQAGCAPLPPPAPLPEISSVAELVARMQTRRQGVSAFQGRGRVTLLSGQHHYSGAGVIKGRLPSTLRVDLFDPFGGALLSFYSDGQVVQFLSPKEGKFSEGPATAENLAAVIPPGMTLEQVVHCLAGEVPLSAGPPADWRFDKESQRYLLEWHTGRGLVQERLWVDARTFYPVVAEWYDGEGGRRFSVELNDYDTLVPGRPRRLKVLTYQPEAELHLAFREWQPNPVVGKEDWQLHKPR